MVQINFSLSLEPTPSAHESNRAVLAVLANALVSANLAYLKRHPKTPWLYQSGVTYAREPRGYESWGDIGANLAARFGDCEDLACWRVAELKYRKIDIRARPHVVGFPRADGSGYTYHIAVKRGNRAIEDPSAKLGMRPAIPWKGKTI